MVVLTGMQPVLAVDDLSADVRYYVNQLGFSLDWTWGEPPVRAGLVRDGFELQLVSDRRFAPSCPSRIYFLVRDVDAYYTECVERGVEIDLPLEDRSFGMRDFRVVDPSGNVLAFGQALARKESDT